MSFDIYESKNKVTLVLAGDLTIAQICAACEELQNALKRVEHIELDIEAVEAVDLTLFRLLFSAHRSSLNTGKNIVFKGNLPPIFKKPVEDSGYVRPQGCKYDANKNCLWIIK